MELSATAVPKGLTAEEVLELAQQQWFRTPELCEILANHEILKILLISQRQERPTNGAFFAIDMQKLREFRKDGHVWAKKKDGKTIQESHENLKIGGVEKLNCLYTYGEKEKNFQRRIYRMIKKEHDVDIVLFHYREDKKNRKNYKRCKKITKVTLQSSQETEKVIPTWAVTDSSSVIVDHSSNQLSLSSQTTNTGNLNIQKNVESAGCSLLHLAPKTADIGNQNNVLANAQPLGSSFGIVNHENYQLPLPPNTTDSSTQSNIQGNAESADLQQDLMQITDAEFSGSNNFNSFTGDVMLHYDSEFENQSFPQETRNDFFTNLPHPATPGSPSELPDLMKYMELTTEVKIR